MSEPLLSVARPGIDYRSYYDALDGDVFGRVEVLSPQWITGWVLIKGKSVSPKLTITFRGHTVLQAVCDIQRKDISDLIQVGDEAYGFRLAFPLTFRTSYLNLLNELVVSIQDSCCRLSMNYVNTIEYSSKGFEPRRLPPFSKSSEIMFSVVIPVYDRTQELRESIQSILSQTYTNFELLLVGDAPPHATMQILADFARHPKVRQFILPDRSGNACRGRNVGITMARGEVIVFQDSDDVAFPQRLESAAHVFRNIHDGNVQLIYTSATALMDGSRIIEGIEFGQVMNAQLVPFEVLREHNPVFTCTACVRRDVLLTRGGFRREMIYREDHELWLRLAHYGAVFHVVTEPQALYRIHAGNAELTFIDRDALWKERMLELYSTPWNTNWLE